MNLHRVTDKADWEKITPSERNIFQRVAAVTHGIAAPANVVTAIGLLGVVWGLVVILQGQLVVGLLLVLLGRLLDIVDGVVAELTATKSPLGEWLDVVADKIGTVLTVATLFIGGVAEWLPLLILIIPQVIIALVVLAKKLRNIQVHPTRQGKLSMLLVWVGVVGLIVVEIYGEAWPLSAFVSTIIVSSLLLGLYASWQYATGRDQ